MSLTIIGAITGFVGSAIPEVLEIFKKKQENKHQIELSALQVQAKKQNVELDLMMFDAKKDYDESKQLREHDIQLAKGTGFFAGLSKSVRPMLTYFFFGLFATVKISYLVTALQSNDFNQAVNLIWDEDTGAMFAAIMTFWFGNRQFEKRKG